ncbi:hypothetical protein EGW08_005678 [Elysia chlorotica]|uniref:Uncharacterized protein n=1 Tax=Elysia chlorotica TaxID=188477 RepID=A0A433TY84_ELYCH|nr:hypothetical protein EGW08_005678 [Elysia chlorotica]
MSGLSCTYGSDYPHIHMISDAFVVPILLRLDLYQSPELPGVYLVAIVAAEVGVGVMRHVACARPRIDILQLEMKRIVEAARFASCLDHFHSAGSLFHLNNLDPSDSHPKKKDSVQHSVHLQSY